VKPKRVVQSDGSAWPWQDRVIASVDLDCFYAQCETLRRPELKGKPVGVQQKLLVVTSNYEVSPCFVDDLSMPHSFDRTC
jgi:hypothetical protein